MLLTCDIERNIDPKPDSWPSPVGLGSGRRSLECSLNVYVCKSLSFSLLNVLVCLFLVDYPMQLLPNPHSTPVKRSSGTVFRQVHYLALICRSSQMFHFVVFINDESQNDFVLKDTSQPLNLTAKPKTPSPQALELAHLQTGYRPRDLPHSPPRSALSLSM